MKYAVISKPDRRGTETGQTCLILSPEEMRTVIEAVHMYADIYRKSKPISVRLKKELEWVPYE